MMNVPRRRGKVVFRKATSATPTLHRLLHHVRKRGIDWVPEPLGTEGDEERLTFLEGEVPHGMPSWIWSPEVLVEVAGKLRQWHDATRDFPREGAAWGFSNGTPDDVICHNDFAPYNCVFQEGRRMTGLIDFDLCCPGSRLWDLSYSVYRFLPLMPNPPLEEGDDASPFTAQERSHRLRLFLHSYGTPPDGQAIPLPSLYAAVSVRLQSLSQWTRAYALQTGNETLDRNARMYARHAEWIAREMQA
ncbi:MAG: aminoglycoside phosphotransferase family protein [Fibrobacteria bacterium]|nr:aminoglycoside phosphotransferase family protein [Fibrobacteria bacterium]